jgi:hypothetical protein
MWSFSMTAEQQAISYDFILAVILGVWMFVAYHRSKQVQSDRREAEAFARALQQALHRGQPTPQMPERVAGLHRDAPSGQPRPQGGWWPLSEALAGQEVKILMDVYTNMQRRLEHYRQLGVTLVFGFFALFSLIDTALFKADNPGNRHAAEGLVMEVLILLAVSFGHHLLAMVRKNFEESGGVIQAIERWTGMFEPITLVPDGPLLPADWPSGNDARDRAEFRQIGWLDDIIPRTQKIILIVGWLEAIYVCHEYGLPVAQAVQTLLGY